MLKCVISNLGYCVGNVIVYHAVGDYKSARGLHISRPEGVADTVELKRMDNHHP